MTTDVSSPINRLLRGIASRHVETTRDAWRALLDGGDASKAALLEKLDSTSWSEKPRGPSAEYFGVLLAALHELDPEAFKPELDRLQNTTLHPLHRKTLRLLQAREADSPVGHVSQNIPVYVAGSVDGRPNVLDVLCKWTQTKGLNLENVTRIDVIKGHDQQDYLGKYSLYFSGIILVWPEASQSRLVSWLLARRAEHTFYHEVGHHISGHLEGGSVAKQEKEADAYALKMMGQAYPLLKAFLYVFYYPARWVRTELRNRSKLDFGQKEQKRHG